MKILVTGGAGFIGSHLIKKLIQQRHEVVAIDNLNAYYSPTLKKDRLNRFLDPKKFSFIKLDICDQAAVDKLFSQQEFQVIIHLAAMPGVRYSMNNPKIYEKINVQGSLNIFQAGVEQKIKKIIYASSSSVYSGNRKFPLAEADHIQEPLSFYGATKRALELMANIYAHNYPIETIGLRYFTVYGPWGRPDLAYYQFVKKIIQGKPIDIHNQGQMSRSFTYIDDAIQGTMAVLQNQFSLGKNHLYNVGSEREVKLLDFIFLIQDLIGKEAHKNFINIQPGEAQRTKADNSKLKKLGWQSQVDLKQGMGEFIKWFRRYYEL
ncbi:MAG: NAD-dependent epimerase/dehydratase family protein [Candidatus Moranbacteria bacterium]|nr:NAD-dependent epimerase/dehydratase family protein [Candidatus Moranbacteria bacterium]